MDIPIYYGIGENGIVTNVSFLDYNIKTTEIIFILFVVLLMMIYSHHFNCHILTLDDDSEQLFCSLENIINRYYGHE